jgi:hypothetical protein
MSPSVTALFVDVGGVLLTNAWDHIARRRAVEHFALDQEALTGRHNLIFTLYEEGKLSLDEYLDRTVFYGNRSPILGRVVLGHGRGSVMNGPWHGCSRRMKYAS